MALLNWPSLHGDAFQGKRVLVTGAAGFIGSHLSEALAALGATVVAMDDLSFGDRANLQPAEATGPGHVLFRQASILDPAELAEAAAGCELIFHQAAWGSVPRSCEIPLAYHQVNATGTLQLLEAARASGVQRVVFAASSAAYGQSEELPKHEAMAPSAFSPYAANKIAGEALLQAYAGSFPLDTVSLRYFNIFGPRQNAHSAYAAVIAAFAQNLDQGKAPVIYGTGEQTRDFTFVDNVVHANLLAARHRQPLRGAILNVASGQRISVQSLALQMTEFWQRSDLKPRYVEPRAGDVLHSQACLQRIGEVLGYEPLVDFSSGLKATCAWYQQSLRAE
ncbi:NAD-dependent epimerase/dehydratase family protein [Paenalcaligenes hermetiae]|uniref:SDR family oxidoreductase n=1 Tax=Paenalcaligenes hermetiae TaxID=1157987 RepID=A0ABP9LWP1_9BURK